MKIKGWPTRKQYTMQGMKTNRRVGQTECYARRLYLPVDKTARRGNGRSSYTPSQHNDIDLPDDHSGIPDNHNHYTYYLCPFRTEFFERGLPVNRKYRTWKSWFNCCRHILCKNYNLTNFCNVFRTVNAVKRGLITLRLTLRQVICTC